MTHSIPPYLRLLACLLSLISSFGCASRVAEREVEKASVLRTVADLNKEQGQWRIAVNETGEHIERILAEKRRQSAAASTESADATFARIEVISMGRDPQAPFRYRGRVRLQQPAAFRGKEVDGYLLSHQRDLTALAGQTIEIAMHDGILAQQLEPMGAFSIDGHSTFAAEDRDGRIQQFDHARFSKELPLTGRIVAYAADPENKIGYFMFDILFSGDVATVQIESPKQYRGTKLRVLVEQNAGPARSSWRQVDALVRFSTAESTVAWEPWGFTRAAELKDVTFSIRR